LIANPGESPCLVTFRNTPLLLYAIDQSENGPLLNGSAPPLSSRRAGLGKTPYSSDSESLGKTVLMADFLKVSMVLATPE